MAFDKTWAKVLGAGERVEYEFSLSSRFLNFNLFFWFVIGLATVWIYGAGIVIFAAAYFYFGFFLRWANHFAITNKRILIHRGWLSTSMTSVDFSQITDIQVRQSFADKVMFKSGVIMVNTAGSSAYEVTLTTIENPYQVKQKLSEAMEKYEQSYRLGTNPNK